MAGCLVINCRLFPSGRFLLVQEEVKRQGTQTVALLMPPARPASPASFIFKEIVRRIVLVTWRQVPQIQRPIKENQPEHWRRSAWRCGRSVALRRSSAAGSSKSDVCAERGLSCLTLSPADGESGSVDGSNVSTRPRTGKSIFGTVKRPTRPIEGCRHPFERMSGWPSGSRDDSRHALCCLSFYSATGRMRTAGRLMDGCLICKRHFAVPAGSIWRTSRPWAGDQSGHVIGGAGRAPIWIFVSWSSAAMNVKWRDPVANRCGTVANRRIRRPQTVKGRRSGRHLSTAEWIVGEGTRPCRLTLAECSLGPLRCQAGDLHADAAAGAGRWRVSLNGPLCR